MKQYNEKMKEVAENREVNFIDLGKNIPKLLDYFTDEVHYTVTKFNLISKALAE